MKSTGAWGTAAALACAVLLAGCASDAGVRDHGDDHVASEAAEDFHGRALQVVVAGEPAQLARFDAALRARLPKTEIGCRIGHDGSGDACGDLREKEAREAVYTFMEDGAALFDAIGQAFAEAGPSLSLKLEAGSGRVAFLLLRTACSTYGANCVPMTCPAKLVQCSVRGTNCTGCGH